MIGIEDDGVIAAAGHESLMFRMDCTIASTDDIGRVDVTQGRNLHALRHRYEMLKVQSRDGGPGSQGIAVSIKSGDGFVGIESSGRSSFGEDCIGKFHSMWRKGRERRHHTLVGSKSECCQVDDMTDARVVITITKTRSTTDDGASVTVPDENHIAHTTSLERFQGSQDTVRIVVQVARRFHIDAMARQIDGEAGYSPTIQFGLQSGEAPAGMPCSVHEDDGTCHRAGRVVSHVVMLTQERARIRSG